MGLAVRARVPAAWEPFGIHMTIVNPGFFRTELLTEQSRSYAEPTIEDYAERNAQQQRWVEHPERPQAGDLAKLALALLTIADEAQPPQRFIAGADAIDLAEQRATDLNAAADAHRELSTNLAIDDTQPA